MTTFADLIGASPIYAVTENGRGFLPPLMRAYGHILYLAGRQAESTTRRPSVEEVAEEFKCAITHLNAMTPTTLTPASSEGLENAVQAINAAIQEFEGWSASQRETNFVTLANYLLSKTTVNLDREFIGLRDSDIGSSV